MPCPDNNPCAQPTCDACNPTPCYQNCGCLNPTDWECVNNPGTQDSIGVTNSNNGLEVLVKIEDAIQDLKDLSGTVKISDSDDCPDFLFDKLQPGTNIAITQTGTGCARRLVITGGVGIGAAAADVYAKVSATDTTTDYLTNKFNNGTYVQKTIISPAGNEKIKFDVVPSTLISTDSGNQLSLGTDGKFKTLYTAPDGTETKIVGGAGVTVTGLGSIASPYVISTNPSIQAANPAFTGVWQNLTLTNSGVSGVSVVSQNVKFRVRFDGSIEFKGNITFTVVFPGSGNGIISVPNSATLPALVGITPTSLSRVADLKQVTYQDPTGTVNTDDRHFSYLIRKGGGNISFVFDSSFSQTKTLVVCFDSTIYHPDF
jgi:hypothetical protein